MKITSWNCRGFGRKKKEEALKDIIKTSKTDIILLQETKMDSQDLLKATQVSLEKQSRNRRKCKGSLRRARHPVEYQQIRADQRRHEHALDPHQTSTQSHGQTGKPF
jgi:exonuclease III